MVRTRCHEELALVEHDTYYVVEREYVGSNLDQHAHRAFETKVEAQAEIDALLSG